MQESGLGLRDRKRLETRARMERSAVEIVLRDGLAHATVDAISDAAHVSPRTFFNYFESKEDAILGLQSIHLTDELVQAHIPEAESGDIIPALIGLLLELFAPVLSNSALHDSRTTIIQLYPELLSRHLAQKTRISDELTRAVQTLMAYDSRFSSAEAAQNPLAELILALCGTAVRVAIKEEITDTREPSTTQIKIRAITLARETVEKLND